MLYTIIFGLHTFKIAIETMNNPNQKRSDDEEMRNNANSLQTSKSDAKMNDEIRVVTASKTSDIVNDSDSVFKVAGSKMAGTQTVEVHKEEATSRENDASVMVHEQKLVQSDEQNAEIPTKVTPAENNAGKMARLSNSELWTKKFEEWKEYCKKHKTPYVYYSRSPSLHRWAHYQRQQRQSLSAVQIELLNKAGFKWKHVRKKSMPMPVMSIRTVARRSMPTILSTRIDSDSFPAQRDGAINDINENSTDKEVTKSRRVAKPRVPIENGVRKIDVKTNDGIRAVTASKTSDIVSKEKGSTSSTNCNGSNQVFKVAGLEMAVKQTVGVHKEAISCENDANMIVRENKSIGLAQSDEQKAEVPTKVTPAENNAGKIARLQYSEQWTKNFEEWKEYCKKYNTPHVHYSVNQPLYAWAHYQRRERRSLSALQIELLDKAGFMWKHDPVAARIAIGIVKKSGKRARIAISSSQGTRDGTNVERKKGTEKRSPINDVVHKSMRATKNILSTRIDSNLFPAQRNGAIYDICESNTYKEETKGRCVTKSRAHINDEVRKSMGVSKRSVLTRIDSDSSPTQGDGAINDINENNTDKKETKSKRVVESRAPINNEVHKIDVNMNDGTSVVTTSKTSDIVSEEKGSAGLEISGTQTAVVHNEATSREKYTRLMIHNNRCNKLSWQVKFETWKKYYMKHNSNPRSNSKNVKDKSLYHWIMEQRRNRNKMSAERIELLDAAGFVWENSSMVSKSVTWEKRFEEWKEYCQKYNTPHVHYSLSQTLYAWANMQRKERDSLSAVQIELLDNAGFMWKHDPVAARIAIGIVKKSGRRARVVGSSSQGTSDGTNVECKKGTEKRSPINDVVHKSMRATKNILSTRIDSNLFPAQSNGTINGIDESNAYKEETQGRYNMNMTGEDVIKPRAPINNEVHKIDVNMNDGTSVVTASKTSDIVSEEKGSSFSTKCNGSDHMSKVAGSEIAGTQTVEVRKEEATSHENDASVMVRENKLIGLVQSDEQKAEVTPAVNTSGKIARLKHSEQWTKSFEDWKEYCKKHKTPHVHNNLSHPLYTWAYRQRKGRRSLSAVQIELLDKAGFKWKHDPVAAKNAMEHHKSSNSSSYDTNEGANKDYRKSKEKRAPLNDEVRKSVRVAKRRGPARMDSAQSNGAINDIDVSNIDKDETKSMHFAKSRGRLIDSEQDDNNKSKRIGKKRGRPPKSDTHHLVKKRGRPSKSSALSIESSNGQAETKVSA